MLQTFIYLAHMAPDPAAMFGQPQVDIEARLLTATAAWMKLLFKRTPPRDAGNFLVSWHKRSCGHYAGPLLLRL